MVWVIWSSGDFGALDDLVNRSLGCATGDVAVNMENRLAGLCPGVELQAERARAVLGGNPAAKTN